MFNAVRNFFKPSNPIVPNLVNHPLSFDDIGLAFFPGFVNTGRPGRGDTLIVATSCGMGVSIRSEYRVRCTGKIIGKYIYDGSRNGMYCQYVETDNGLFPLQDVRRTKFRGHWIYIR